MSPNDLQPPQLAGKDERTWAMLCHLSALVGYFLIPFGSILGPLIVWLMKKNDSPFVDDQGKESLNFQISMLIYMTMAGLSMLFLIGFILVPIVYLFALIYTVVGSIAASNGQRYRYPLTIKFVN